MTRLAVQWVLQLTIVLWSTFAKSSKSLKINDALRFVYLKPLFDEAWSRWMQLSLRAAKQQQDQQQLQPDANAEPLLPDAGDEPPAIEGTMLMVSPSLVGVFSFAR